MKRGNLITFSLLGVAELILGGLLYHHYVYELDRRLEFHGAGLDTGFTTIVDSYRQVVEVVFKQDIQKPEVIDLLAAADGASDAVQSKQRGRLYRHLYPLYKLLREQDIRVLHFVLTDGSSFLRFNRPDLYGDSIASDRPLLREVLIKKLPGQAFENGRVYPGFRYSFPLLKDSEIVAVADFSVAFDALHRILLQRAGSGTSFKQFLIRRNLMQEVVHPSALNLFVESQIHPAYVMEDETSGLRDITWSPEIPAYVKALNAALARNKGAKAIIDEGRTAGIYQCLPDRSCYAVSFKPVTDSLNRSAAYIVDIAPTDELGTIYNQHLTAFLVGSLLLFGSGIGIRRWLKSRQRLQTISQNMAEGMYVMDNKGRVIFVNRAACEMLGYTKAELKGCAAHDLFHAHSNGAVMKAADCPIRCVPLAGGTYTGSNELFRRQDGSLVRVSVSSSPLREEGEITGAVVLFRDITAEHKSRVRLQQSDIAFRNLAEAVLVTDAESNIVAVNRAFTDITGYTEEQVLGRNPRLLASGRHDPDFYRTMWRKIESDGAWQGEIWNRRKSGEIYPEWLSITAIRDDDAKVISYVSVFSDITDIRHKEERLRELAFHDQLTGLPNRASFQDLFEHALQRADRRGAHLALIFLDIDNFKKINDTLGHLIGDRLLQTIAKRIRATVRKEDVVARLGGDEFTVLLDDISYDETPARIARKLLDVLRQPIEIELKQLHVSASIGISLFPQDGRDTVNLLKNADAAMYLSKRAGRDSYSYFTESMAHEAEERFALENDLRSALAGGQFLLHYQPKVWIDGCSLVGLEALLRWQHPLRGMVRPDQFLEIAGEAGLLPDITEWVVRSAARQLSSWREQGLEPGRIAINLDGQTVKTTDAPQKLERWVRKEGATPNELELEIVETVILHKGASRPLWQELVDVGFSLSIDDFGTGESSLFRLKHLPVKTLKVDKSFVDDIDREESDRAVMRSIVSMAKSLGKTVLAEGVERESQFNVLNEIGCDQIQGYLIGKPAPAEEITKLLKAEQETASLLQPGERSARLPRVH